MSIIHEDGMDPMTIRVKPFSKDEYDKALESIDCFSQLYTDEVDIRMLAHLVFNEEDCQKIRDKEKRKGVHKRSLANQIKFSPSSSKLREGAFLNMTRIIEECYIKGTNRIGLIRKYLRCYLEEENFHDQKLRARLWSILSGARYEQLINNKDYYSKILEVFPNLADFYSVAIENDLKRTIGIGKDANNSIAEEDMNKMRRILLAYSRRNSYLGYCQGMNFIVAKLVSIFSDEEEAFWVFVHIIENVLQLDYFSSMNSALIDQKVLTMLIQQNGPEVGAKFLELGFDLSMVSIQWFVCLFTTYFNEELTNVVWDFLFCEGDGILFKAAIWVLATLKNEIVKAQDFPEIILLIENKAKKLTKADDLRHFLSVKPMHKRVLEILRERIRKETKPLLEKEPKVSPINFIKHTTTIPCNLEWPYCHIKLNKKKNKSRKKSFVALRQGSGFLIIDNHFTKRNKAKKMPVKKLTALESLSFAVKRDFDFGGTRKSFINGHHQLPHHPVNTETILMYRTDHTCMDMLNDMLRTESEDENSGTLREEIEIGSKKRSASLQKNALLRNTMNEVEYFQPPAFVKPKTGPLPIVLRRSEKPRKSPKFKGETPMSKNEIKEQLLSGLNDKVRKIRPAGNAIKEEEGKDEELVVEEVPDNYFTYNPDTTLKSSVMFFGQMNATPHAFNERLARSQSLAWVQQWTSNMGEPPERMGN